jgi:hypothetical protein
MTTMQQTSASAGMSGKPPRFRISGLGQKALDGTTTWSLGQICHDHVMANLYATLDATGEIVSIEAVPVGSC